MIRFGNEKPSPKERPAERIKLGLEDAIAYAKGDETKAIVRKPKPKKPTVPALKAKIEAVEKRGKGRPKTNRETVTIRMEIRDIQSLDAASDDWRKNVGPLLRKALSL